MFLFCQIIMNHEPSLVKYLFLIVKIHVLPFLFMFDSFNFILILLILFCYRFCSVILKQVKILNSMITLKAYFLQCCKNMTDYSAFQFIVKCGLNQSWVWCGGRMDFIFSLYICLLPIYRKQLYLLLRYIYICICMCLCRFQLFCSQQSGKCYISDEVTSNFVY